MSEKSVDLEKEELKPRPPRATIKMRKNSLDMDIKGKFNPSIVIYETLNNQVSFCLKNEKEFLNINNVKDNLQKVRYSLQFTPDGFKIKNKFENSIDNLNIVTFNKNSSQEKEIEKLKTVYNHDGNLPEKQMHSPSKNKNKEDENEIILPMTNQEVIDVMDKGDQIVNHILVTKESKLEDLEDSNGLEFENLTETITINEGRIKVNSQKQVLPRLVLETDQNYETNQVLYSHPNQKMSISPFISKPNVIVFKNHNMLEEMFYKREETERSHETNFPLKICFICDQFYLKDKTYNCEKSNHYFCRRCGKCFYEEKIETGEEALKCPVYKCTNKISLDALSSLVSEKHMQNYKNKRESPGDTRVGDNNYLKMGSMILYSQKHVIDINTNESFFIYNKAKEQFCVKCYQPSLYGKNGKYVVKCLNCFHSICKFCMKNYSSDHFEITSNGYCKVYFRRRLKKFGTKETKFFKVLGFNILVFIASYIMILLFFYKYISNLSEKVVCINITKKNNCVKSLIYYLIVILLCSFVTPFLFLIIPYWPPLYTLMQ
jgi:hypothetical protein